MVIDYGIGNLLNVVRALEYCGAAVTVVDEAADVTDMPERLVLPGVGAFAGGMVEMRQRGFDDFVKHFAQTERPFLGICVGAQMLFEVGEEFGEHAGLGLLPGRVAPVPARKANGELHRIPHIGWSALELPASRTTWADTPLARFNKGESAYFVHSFAPAPLSDADRLADTFYDGVRICAAVGKDNVWGCQFHPERSGEAGLGILASFLAM
ncbi:MAG: imidazole glycerol phosphate synthase subunit HisH [Pseudomonadota bacterium]